MKNNKKILFTTPQLSFPPCNGPTLKGMNSLKALSKLYSIHLFVNLPFSYFGGESATTYYKGLCEKVCFSPSSQIELSTNRLVRLFQKKHYQQKDIEFLIEYIKNEKIDLLWVNYGNISFHLIAGIRKRYPDLPIISDTDSVWSRFILRGIPFTKSYKEKIKKFIEGHIKTHQEKRSVELCNVTTAVSEIDAEYYRSITDKKDKIFSFSNVVDIDEYRLNPQHNYAPIKHPSIYLAGYFGPQSPMDDAARWMINNVLPLIREKIKDFHFYIIGTDSKETLADIHDPQITITGKLDSVLPYLHQVDICLVPLRFESGTRFKILEAGACAKAVISTTLGAEGIPITNRKDIIIADTPQEFANSIIELFQNRELAHNLGTNLFQLIQSNFSITSLTKETKNIYNYIFRAI